MPETTRVWAKIGVGNEWLVLDRPKSAMRSEKIDPNIFDSWNIPFSSSEVFTVSPSRPMVKNLQDVSNLRVWHLEWAMAGYHNHVESWSPRCSAKLIRLSLGIYMGTTQIPWMITSFPIEKIWKADFGGSPPFSDTSIPECCFSTRRCQLLKDVAVTPHQCIPTGAFRRIHFPGHSRSWLLIVTVSIFWNMARD